MSKAAKNLWKRWAFGIILGLVLESVAGVAQPAQASGISGTWSGASASVSYFGQSQSNQGATASALAGGSVRQYYSGSSGGSPGYSEQTTGSVQASAGGSFEHLLNVTAGGYSPDPGVVTSRLTQNTDGDASAQWTGDSAVVTSKPGGTIPNAIQLNFALTITAPGQLNGAKLTATVNGTTLGYLLNPSASNFGSSIYGPETSLIDSSTSQRYLGSGWTRVDTFHLIVPLNASGQSSPINLGLDLETDFGLHSSVSYEINGLGANLALTSVTLPGGASLASMGDSVSFASGLGSAEVVPEPSTLIGWALVVGIAGMASRWRSRARQS